MNLRLGRAAVLSVLLVLVVGAALGFTWWVQTGSFTFDRHVGTPSVKAAQKNPGDNKKDVKLVEDGMVPSDRRAANNPATSNPRHRVAEPLPTGSGPQAVSDLERRADAGDRAAMAQLSRIFRMCPNRERYENAQGSGVVEKTLSEHGDDPVFTGGDKNAGRAFRRHFGNAVQQLCVDFQATDKKQAAQTFWYWLQRAADAGDTTAMVNYAGNVVSSWPDVEGADLRGGRAPLAHIEGIERYRQRAVGYLQTAREKGDPAALLILSQQYAAGSLFQIDLVKSCAYVLAFRSTSAMESPVNRRSSWFLLAQLQDELDPPQLARAQLVARQIEASFVERIRVGP